MGSDVSMYDIPVSQLAAMMAKTWDSTQEPPSQADIPSDFHGWHDRLRPHHGPVRVEERAGPALEVDNPFSSSRTTPTSLMITARPSPQQMPPSSSIAQPTIRRSKRLTSARSCSSNLGSPYHAYLSRRFRRRSSSSTATEIPSR
ncbi:hypothetical protein CONLIGDRAFT_650001 [Coniochaeta ligniaria NRRL 30616]|uniref:Uncharacterized protein n=1 Tax=Coniochaeta ligniaria NRRL 30616 TaxID=1408157 RepID=A0A1J7J221_9PEZI|nr:hypothetical protein CONLIGDRAFT_650001 [Coniochaeta ligniaria NRRL 30616]